MKLACDSCGAKYSIGDDRVAGKVFKIRCKKCSHVIVVRGAALPSVEPEPAPAVTTSGEWHAVIGGQQAGPFELDELARRRDAGELDDDSFIWREGMPDWVALGTLDELRRPPVAIADTPAEPPPTLDSGDATRLRNERNESSVLFTLGNLAKLAAPQPAKATPATGEGSGLIDIRALASSLAPPAKHAKHAGSLDDLPVYAPAGFGEPIVLVPMARRATIDRRIVVALVAMLAMLAVVATVLVVVLTRDGGTAQAAPSAPRVSSVEAPAPKEPAPPERHVAPPPERVVAGPPAAPAPPAPAPPAPKIRTTTRTTTATTRSTRSSAATTTPPPSTLTLKPPQEDKCTDVGCAFSNYAEKCCDAFKPRTRTTTTTPTTPGDLPENLDRAALAKGIATIKAQACGGASSARGDVSVSVKVTPEGSVSSVTVKSTPDPALAACVVAAAKRGTFAKTKRGGSFSYPWRF